MSENNSTWKKAFVEGIILVPFNGKTGYLTVACPIETLEKVVGKENINDWERIYDLGYGWFAEVCPPGYGETLEESYLSALTTFHNMQELEDPAEERRQKVLAVLGKRTED